MKHARAIEFDKAETNILAVIIALFAAESEREA